MSNARSRGTARRYLLALVIVLGLAALLPFAPATARAGAPLAPDFTLTDIYGHTFTLSSFRGTSVVVIEFTSLSCSACQIVEQSLSQLQAQYNRSGTTQVHIVSIYIEPSYGDTIPALRAYHNAHNITWTMAQDTPSLAVSTAYAVSDIPVVVIVDKQGHAVYDSSGIQSTATLQTTINSALVGTATTISIVTVSVFALAAVAGVTTFFSPCAFPMFPGYMSLFLGLNVGQSASPTAANGSYRSAARRAFAAGSVSAVGMLIVFLAIGVALIVASSFVDTNIPKFLIVVGAILIGLGALLFTNLQYWRIVEPFQRLGRRLSGKKANEVSALGPSADGRGLYWKLFGYGMGYAAAAAGCVAPVILSAIVAGMALGLASGILSILIFSLTAACLMIGVTLALAVAGRKYVNQLKALTPLIKKVSAGVLIVVGVYLIYFYYTAWVV
jgi:cytochrome c-type biogenesis protein